MSRGWWWVVEWPWGTRFKFDRLETAHRSMLEMAVRFRREGMLGDRFVARVFPGQNRVIVYDENYPPPGGFSSRERWRRAA